MCLLMFACLPVYLFFCLFIIWKCLYKLSLIMFLLFQTSFYNCWFSLELKKEEEKEKG